MSSPLATRAGRLRTFFVLYMSEGIPFGFTSVAVATHLRREGVGAAEIGAFVGSLFLPWAWKWLMGPVIDVFWTVRFGRRAQWIVAAQVMMAVTLAAGFWMDPAAGIGALTTLILLHNIFAATQDVAIDALACSVLPEEERGTANGLMFAGSYIGTAIGGAGVLFLTEYAGFRASFLLVTAALAAITLSVSVRLREAAPDSLAYGGASAGWSALLRRIGHYVKTAAWSFVGSRAALLGVLFALLPTGAMALGLSLQTNLAVELQLTDNALAWLSLVSTVLAAVGCIVGGLASDRFGRRSTIAAYIVGTIVPTLWLAEAARGSAWPAGDGSPPAGLVATFWACSLLFNFVQGLIYGARTALFMDVCNPVVAATQFTAYMALLNVTLSYTSLWQGVGLERWGYPATLVIDAALGCIALAVLPWMHVKTRAAP